MYIARQTDLRRFVARASALALAPSRRERPLQKTSNAFVAGRILADPRTGAMDWAIYDFNWIGDHLRSTRLPKRESPDPISGVRGALFGFFFEVFARRYLRLNRLPEIRDRYPDATVIPGRFLRLRHARDKNGLFDLAIVTVVPEEDRLIIHEYFEAKATREVSLANAASRLRRWRRDLEFHGEALFWWNFAFQRFRIEFANERDWAPRNAALIVSESAGIRETAFEAIPIVSLAFPRAEILSAIADLIRTAVERSLL